MASPDADEDEASQIVSAALGAVSIHRDFATHLGLHDFDLVFPDEHVEALEVTQSTDEARRSQAAAMNKEGTILGPAAHEKSWIVTLYPTANIKALKRNLEQLGLALMMLEQVGILNFIVERDRYRSIDVQTFHEHFPEVKDCWAWTSSSAPHIEALPAGAASMIGPGVVTGHLQAFLRSDAQQDNLRKLARTNARERHLFVWLRGVFGPQHSLCEGELPTGAADLPSEVTQVWVAATCDEGVVMCWRGSKGGWSKVPVEAS